jgi:hypothetical protein
MQLEIEKKIEPVSAGFYKSQRLPVLLAYLSSSSGGEQA